MAIFRFGLGFGSVSAPGVEGAEVFERISEVASAADESGIDALFVPDHVWQNDRGGAGRSSPMLEAYTLLGAVAARTSVAKLGALVTAVTFRNPAVLAKTVTTLDVISHGRAILGLGAAWDKEEHQSYGIEFPETRQRMDRLEEALRICRAMFDDESPNFTGTHYEIHAALNVPHPVSERIPILIGGGGETRTLRLVAQYGDACNVFGDAEQIKHKFEVLRQHCDAIGRDYAAITKTTNLAMPDDVDALRNAAKALFDGGVDAIILVGAFPEAQTVSDFGTALRAAFG